MANVGKQGVNSVSPLEDDDGGVGGHQGGEALELHAADRDGLSHGGLLQRVSYG